VRVLSICEECNNYATIDILNKPWMRCRINQEGLRKEKEYCETAVPSSCSNLKKHNKSVGTTEKLIKT